MESEFERGGWRWSRERWGEDERERDDRREYLERLNGEVVIERERGEN